MNGQARRVGVVGASGYSGVELTRLLARHPGVELVFATSDRWGGESLSKRMGPPGARYSLKYAALDQSLALSKGCDAVLLATPAEVSHKLAPAGEATP